MAKKKLFPKMAEKKATKQANRTKKPLFQKRNGVSASSISVIANKKTTGLFGAKINGIAAKRVEKRAAEDKGVTRSIFAAKKGSDGKNAVANIFNAKKENTGVAGFVSKQIEIKNAQKYGTEPEEEIEMRDAEVENNFSILANKVPVSTLDTKPVSSIGSNVPQEFEDFEDDENLQILGAEETKKTAETKKDNNKMLIIGVIVMVLLGAFFYFKSKK